MTALVPKGFKFDTGTVSMIFRLAKEGARENLNERFFESLLNPGPKSEKDLASARELFEICQLLSEHSREAHFETILEDAVKEFREMLRKRKK